MGVGGLSQQKASGVLYPRRARHALLSPAEWDQRDLQRIPAAPSVFPLGHASSHQQGRSLCSPCLGAQLRGPQRAGSNCRDAQGDSGCSALEHLLPLWGPWAPTGGGNRWGWGGRTAPPALTGTAGPLPAGQSPRSNGVMLIPSPCIAFPLWSVCVEASTSQTWLCPAGRP